MSNSLDGDSFLRGINKQILELKTLQFKKEDDNIDENIDENIDDDMEIEPLPCKSKSKILKTLYVPEENKISKSYYILMGIVISLLILLFFLEISGSTNNLVIYGKLINIGLIGILFYIIFNKFCQI